MKKIFPSILIILILVNIFAPFTLGLNAVNKPAIKKSIAEAGSMTIGITQENTTENSIKFAFNITRAKTAHHKLIYLVSDKPGATMPDYNNIKASITSTNAYLNDYNTNPPPEGDIKPATGSQVLAHGKLDLGSDGTTSDTNADFVTESWPISVTGLTASTTYYLTYFAYNGNKEEGIIGPLEYPIKTTATGVVNTTSQQIAKDTNSDSYMPSCGIADSWLTGGGTILGCIAQLAYYVVFVPSSYIFGLAGMFFDTTFNYSIQDTSYRSDFVVQGWGLIRDFCNIFFIFVLLYIAFATILSIHGFKTKEMIINVVIIGLLINFSLFASQIIIDASNILARVFYTSDAIKVTKNGVAQAGADGTVPISESIVSKINPQMLIKNANQVSVIDKSTGGSASTENTASGLGVGGFILITLLASAINIVGFIVFLSVGLIFVARSIGLWFSMIFAPLAFFSYTVPSMQNMGMVGWKKWWPETISLAFLAPIFIFFLYLILKFIQVGFGLGDVSQMTGIKFILGIILPFIFIMVLLMKAKSIAKDMSGKLGQSITGGIAAVGGLALGGAALGAAFAGRNIVGRGMGALSRTDGAKEYGGHKVQFNKNLEDWRAKEKKQKGSGGIKPTWEMYKANNGVKANVFTRLGGNLNAKQSKIHDVDRARSDWDSLKEKNHLKGVNDSNLSGADVHALEETFKKEKRTEIETDIKQGKADLIDTNGQKVAGGESGYKAANRNRVSMAVASHPNARASGDVDGSGALTDAGKKKIEDQLNVDFNAILKTSTDKESSRKFNELQDKSKQQVSGADRVFAQSNKGSYDARNLSQAKTDKREGLFTKASAGLIAGIAMGVRTGLKGSGVNHGSGQNDFLKDIGHTITEAMKSAKVTVKVEESHGKGGDDHGGGGHH